MSGKPRLLLIRFSPGKQGDLRYEDEKLRVLIGKLGGRDSSFTVFFTKGNDPLRILIESFTGRAYQTPGVDNFLAARIDPHKAGYLISTLKQTFDVSEFQA